MAYRTAHATERALALAAADRLADHGFKFTAKFPYNRYDAGNTAWWLSFKGPPAFDAAKVFVQRIGDSLYTGLVVEKGVKLAEQSSHNLTSDWDWNTVVPPMREAAFRDLLASQEKHKPRIRIHGHLGELKHYLAFQPEPWKRTLDTTDDNPKRLLASLAETTSLPAFIDGLANVPDGDFIWFDLYVCVRLHPARAGDDPVVLDERLVDGFLAPLCAWTWPGLAKKTAGGAP